MYIRIAQKFSSPLLSCLACLSFCLCSDLIVMLLVVWFMKPLSVMRVIESTFHKLSGSSEWCLTWIHVYVEAIWISHMKLLIFSFRHSFGIFLFGTGFEVVKMKLSPFRVDSLEGEKRLTVSWNSKSSTIHTFHCWNRNSRRSGLVKVGPTVLTRRQ